MNKIHSLVPLACILATLVFLTAYSAHAQPSGDQSLPGSFIVMAGSSITEDGSTLVAQNQESESDGPFYLKKYPRTKHDSGDVTRLSNGLEIPRINITAEWLSLENKEGFGGSHVLGVNENQVAVAGRVSLRHDRNKKAREADPLKSGGAPEGIITLALQRARSARECIRIIGDFYNRFGITTAHGIAISDKKEIWYLETGGGRHWAAVRIPNDAVWVQANAYRIGHINPGDVETMASPGLIDFAAQNDLYDPEEELFNFARAFGDRTRTIEANKHFNSRRLWRAISILDSTARVVPSQQEFPQLIRPEEKVSLQKLITVLRDHYENTPYYPLNNDTISEKTIASANTRHTTIIQLTNGLPANVGAVMWTGLGSPNTTPYIPFYFGITTVPEPYDKNTPNGQKAYQTFRSLTDRYYDDPGGYTDTFPGIWKGFQKKLIREQVKIDQGAMRLYRSRATMAQHFITVNVEGLSQQALDIAKGHLE